MVVVYHSVDVYYDGHGGGDRLIDRPRRSSIVVAEADVFDRVRKGRRYSSVGWW